MTHKTAIILEGREYTITTPLTLGQLQDLNVGVALPQASDPQEEMRRSNRRAMDILLYGLAADHPDLNETSLRGMRISSDEMSAAVRKILDISGLVPAKDAKPGEAGAGASTGQD